MLKSLTYSVPWHGFLPSRNQDVDIYLVFPLLLDNFLLPAPVVYQTPHRSHRYLAHPDFQQAEKELNFQNMGIISPNSITKNLKF